MNRRLLYIFGCQLLKLQMSVTCVSRVEQSFAPESNCPPLSHLIRKHDLLKNACNQKSMSVYVCSCRCHGELCAPRCSQDWSDEALFTCGSLYFQLHWIFLFQGSYILLNILFSWTVMSLSLPGQLCLAAVQEPLLVFINALIQFISLQIKLLAHRDFCFLLLKPPSCLLPPSWTETA